MKIEVLASSSRGNCYIIGDKEKLIIECGINFKEIKKALDFNLSSVCGCLVSHEHLDHSKCIKDILKAGIDVYSSQNTFLELNLKHHRLSALKSKIQCQIGRYKVLPFDIQHDAVEPFGFLIQDTTTGEKLLFATDTYYIKYKFKGFNYLMIECNYDNEILENNLAIESLRDRIIQSHFSLKNVKEFLKENDLSKCKKIYLLHLSNSHSDATKFLEEVEELTGIETVVARGGI